MVQTLHPCGNEKWSPNHVMAMNHWVSELPSRPTLQSIIQVTCRTTTKNLTPILSSDFLQNSLTHRPCCQGWCLSQFLVFSRFKCMICSVDCLILHGTHCTVKCIRSDCYQEMIWAELAWMKKGSDSENGIKSELITYLNELRLHLSSKEDIRTWEWITRGREGRSAVMQHLISCIQEKWFI